jgi:hypothetical protein
VNKWHDLHAPTFKVLAMPELTGLETEPEIMFPDGPYRKDGVVFRVETNDRPAWLGRFVFGDFALCDNVMMPDKKMFAVAANGMLHIVDPHNPSIFYQFDYVWILQKICLAGQDCLLIGDIQSLMLWNEHGRQWTLDIADDFLEIENIEGSVLYCTGRDRPHDVRVKVDLQAGKILSKTRVESTL